MHPSLRRPPITSGFTLAEVLLAVAVVALFGLASFATNERLLVGLKSQREATAATMMLQERMEAFRALSYSNIADKTYVKTNIVGVATTSESQLPSLTETITVSGYQAAVSPTPAPSATPSDNYNQWIRNSAHANGQEQNHDDNLAAQFDLLTVDVSISWTSSNGRTRTRDLNAIFGKGNIAQ
jgi:prepilin-type N-terminal cleavage/methylation domain-containing protein